MKKIFLAVASGLLVWSTVDGGMVLELCDTVQTTSPTQMVRVEVFGSDSADYTLHEFRRGRGKRLGLVNGISIDAHVEQTLGKSVRGNRARVVHRMGSDELFRYKFKGTTDGDSLFRQYRMLRREGYGTDVMIVRHRAGNPPMVNRSAVRYRTEPALHRYHQRNKQNSIDLSAPNVISYKKRKMSGGREKITIIRKELGDSDVDQIIEPHQKLYVPQRPVSELEIETVPGAGERRIRIRVDEEKIDR